MAQLASAEWIDVSAI
jgi:hypothetical protein